MSYGCRTEIRYHLGCMECGAPAVRHAPFTWSQLRTARGARALLGAPVRAGGPFDLH